MTKICNHLLKQMSLQVSKHTNNDMKSSVFNFSKFYEPRHTNEATYIQQKLRRSRTAIKENHGPLKFKFGLFKSSLGNLYDYVLITFWHIAISMNML